MGVDAGGADDDFGSIEAGVVDGFEDVFEDAAELALAAPEEAGSVSVTVDGDAVGELMFLGDQLGAAPADEVTLDEVAVRMGADAALASVASEVGRIGIGSVAGFAQGRGFRG